MGTPALIFGHSHVWTVKGAVAAGRVPRALDARVLLCGTTGFPGAPVVKMLDDQIIINPVLLAALRGCQQDCPPAQSWLVSMMQGNHYNKLGVTWQDRPFDLVLPGHETRPLNAAATLLPMQALWDEYEQELTAMTGFIQRVGALAYRGTVVIGVPPPERDPAKRLELLQRQDPSARIEALSTADTLWKLWELQNRVMATVCARHKVHYLRGDLPGTVDADGFLRPEFAKDAAHATVEYSARMLDSLAALIAQEEARS